MRVGACSSAGGMCPAVTGIISPRVGSERGALPADKGARHQRDKDPDPLFFFPILEPNDRKAMGSNIRNLFMCTYISENGSVLLSSWIQTVTCTKRNCQHWKRNEYNISKHNLNEISKLITFNLRNLAILKRLCAQVRFAKELQFELRSRDCIQLQFVSFYRRHFDFQRKYNIYIFYMISNIYIFFTWFQLFFWHGYIFFIFFYMISFFLTGV